MANTEVEKRKRVTEVMHPYTHNYATAMQIAGFIVRNWAALVHAMKENENG